MLRQDGWKQERLATVINSAKVQTLLCLAEWWSYTCSRAFNVQRVSGKTKKKKKFQA